MKEVELYQKGIETCFKISNNKLGSSIIWYIYSCAYIIAHAARLLISVNSEVGTTIKYTQVYDHLNILFCIILHPYDNCIILNMKYVCYRLLNLC